MRQKISSRPRINHQIFRNLIVGWFLIQTTDLHGADYAGYWKVTESDLKRKLEEIYQTLPNDRDSPFVRDLMRDRFSNVVFKLYFSEAGDLKIKVIDWMNIESLVRFTMVEHPWAYKKSPAGDYSHARENGNEIRIWMMEDNLNISESLPAETLQYRRLTLEESDRMEADMAKYGYFDMNLGKDVGKNIMTMEEAMDAGLLTDPDSIFEIVDLDKGPKPLKQAAPVYPDSLRNERLIGEVVVEYIVNEEGKPEDIRIISSPHDEFSKSVITAIENSTFEPCEARGIAVKCRIKQTFSFTLKR